MSQELKLFKKCPQCNGNGVHQSSLSAGEIPTKTCDWPGCNGTGFIYDTRYTLDPGVDDVINTAFMSMNVKINLSKVRMKEIYDKCLLLEEKCNIVEKRTEDLLGKDDDILDKGDDILDKCNDIFQKCNNILSKCDEILSKLP